MNPYRLADLKQQGKMGLARCLSKIEAEESRDDLSDLLDEAWQKPRGIAIGLTGPPGVGKSTLAAKLISVWRKEHLSVGVIAVDPSSQEVGGSLLGDRLRLSTGRDDPDLFIRSFPAGGNLGGLSASVFPAMVIMRALFDRVLIETVGVGQNEQQIDAVADLVILCLQPGSGEALQYMKSGIMDVPDIIAVTKADLGSIAQQTKTDASAAVSYVVDTHRKPVQVFAISAIRDGYEMAAFLKCLEADLQPPAMAKRTCRRQEQARAWICGEMQRRAALLAQKACQDMQDDEQAKQSPFKAERSLRGSLRLKMQ